MTDKYLDTLNKYDVNLSDEEIVNEVKQIVTENFDANNTIDVLKFSLGCIDLTSLNPTDNEERITEFTKRVNDFEEKYPELDNVASICVYPNFAEVVSTNLDVTEVDTTVVAGGFPSSQTFDEIKVAEISLALASRAHRLLPRLLSLPCIQEPTSSRHRRARSAWPPHPRQPL